MGFYPMSTLIHDARRHGVEVRPPCLRGRRVVLHHGTGAATRPALRIGWRHIRGLGKGTGRAAAAGARGAASSRRIADVVERAGLTRAEATAFARAAAFAAWEPDRRKAAWEALRAVGDNLPLAPARRDDTTRRASSTRAS